MPAVMSEPNPFSDDEMLRLFTESVFINEKSAADGLNYDHMFMEEQSDFLFDAGPMPPLNRSLSLDTKNKLRRHPEFDNPFLSPGLGNDAFESNAFSRGNVKQEKNRKSEPSTYKAVQKNRSLKQESNPTAIATNSKFKKQKTRSWAPDTFKAASYEGARRTKSLQGFSASSPAIPTIDSKMSSPKKQRRIKWSDEEITYLWTGIKKHGNEWRQIKNLLPKRTYHQVKDKGRRLLQQEFWKTGRSKLAADGACEFAKEIADAVLSRRGEK
mmetsp:Transcript_9509/g.10835  ORF Transcript_9509/g.10835 Transcript_9509/m.10835 type:complete len:270 (-) Transcript_9509:241-1050(-)|eukprot:CAMPEP_0184020642 /NCGR_PEP_ID=MMETSP0954-20121128/9469_1 /TAXON_ID=627963 /ORGANISM="Aplanochytrium sp, Strain PBS07" /LENGTH=269 /DNA_ID=CAMNT_0026302539 /DNA_START=593 /DNA_END=1402 /DNA_ORIENTATION=-